MKDSASASRRGFLFGLGSAFAALNVLNECAAPVAAAELEVRAPSSAKTARPVPFIHTTDLYNPPQDPDDHVDLATVYALGELDLRAIILDPARAFLGKHDPGFIPVAQMNYLTGRAVPVAIGPLDKLRTPTDTASDRPRREQAGVELLLETLRRSERPVVVSVVGSARAVAVAWNREPKLLREKVAAVVVNAGATSGKPGAEWNVILDVQSWIALMRSDLPILWYPCSGARGATDLHPHNSFWAVSQRVLFDGLAQPLRAFFDYAFHHHSRGDCIRALSQLGSGPSWEKVLAGQRNMWTTASLAMAARRVLAQTAEGWRFVAQDAAARLKQQQLEMLPITCQVDDKGFVRWSLKSGPSAIKIFHREPDAEHVRALGEATNALLRQMPVG